MEKKFFIKFPNIYFYILYILILLILFNLCLSIYFDKFFWNNHRLSEDQTKFYRKYENQLNHLRDLQIKEDRAHMFKEPHNFMFNSFKVENSKKNVLINGDSWIENLLNKKKTYLLLKRFSKNQKISLTISGTTSYSPTPIMIQSRILREDFNIKPNLIITFIDNTDLNDEICRYKNIQQTRDGKLLLSAYKKSEPYIFNHGNILKIYEILNSTDLALIKFIKILRIKIINKRNINADNIQCGMKQMENILINGLNNSDKDYFINTFQKYIEQVTNFNSTQKIFIITFPHFNHLNGRYKLSVGELISNFLNNNGYQKVTHLDFYKSVKNKIELGEFKMEDIFIMTDRASHLTEVGQDFLYNEIISLIKNN